jgi:hypothetical protein
MRLSEVCAQGRRSPAGAHTLGRVPRGSVTVRMYMSTPLWMREGTSLSPPLYWYFSAAWAAGSRCIYSTREGGICILPLFLLSTLILNVPPVLLWAFAPHSRVDSLLSTKERLSVLLSTEERLTYLVLLSTGERLVLLSTGERLWFVLLSTGERLVLLSTGERLWFACCATRSARESVRRRRAPRLVRGRLDCGVPPTKGGAPAY